jgi:RimJ/RimL family protein N-acetyltransferase
MHKLKKVFSILRDHYHSLPFLEFIRFLRNSLFKNEKILIYCKSFKGLDAVNEKASNITLVKGEISDLETGETLERFPGIQCDLYDGVRDFFLYKEKGNIGHISWVYHKNDPNRILRLGEKECEVKFCLTFPEYRGKGLYPAVLQTIQRYLRERGYRRCFICVKDDNTASIRGIEKAGFRIAGTTYVRKAFGLQISSRRDTKHFKDIEGN